LEIQAQLTHAEGVAELLLQFDPRMRGAIELLVEETVTRPAGRLGGVHRLLGRPQQP